MCSSEFNLQGTIMNYLPSKELLSEVLGDEYNDRLVDWFQIEDNYLRTYYDCGRYDYEGRPTGLGIEINIYELAYKCKVWATENKYTILTEDMNPNGYFTYVLSNKESIENYGYLCEHKVIKDIPHNKTEPEAIFAACQWILDNRN